MNLINPSLKEFYVTEYKGYLVSADGRVFDEYENKLLKQYLSSNGYFTVFTRYGSLLIHVLVASVFVKIPSDLCDSKVIVNHKDGVKTNNVAANLEWVTYTGNILHAYETGLRNDNVRVQAKNISTNETLSFSSLSQCAKHFNVNSEAVFRYLKGKRQYFFEEPFVLRREDQEWIALSENGLNGIIPGHAREVIGRLNDLVIMFGSIQACSEYTEVSVAIIKSLLSKRTKNSSVAKGWSFMYLDQFTGNKSELLKIEAKPQLRPIPPTRKPLKARVTCLKTGEVCIKHSLQEIADELNIKKSALQKYIFMNNGKRGDQLIEYIRT